MSALKDRPRLRFRAGIRQTLTNSAYRECPLRQSKWHFPWLDGFKNSDVVEVFADQSELA
jgi:hypothetical protein